MPQDSQALYRGQGRQTEAGWRKISPVDPSPLTDPSKYMAPPELADAVNVALDLGMPLLLTGEPGCGKSELASSIAWELGFPQLPGQTGRHAEPLRFTVKSDTQSNELFYRFDTLGRFHKKVDGTSHPREFITYDALGKAILYAWGRDRLAAEWGEKKCLALMRKTDWDELPAESLRSVVLIDEIDKAPREVPNDILNEIQTLGFKIPELYEHFPDELAIGKVNECRPVIIITSNDERPLPKAFLRRCVYYHMQPPPYRGENWSIESIVKTRLGERFEKSLQAAEQKRLLDEAIGLYEHLRLSDLEKKPNIAELLAWVYYLSRQKSETGEAPDKTHHLFQRSAQTALLKLRKDQDKGKALIEEWVKAKG
ncbi:MAG: AAA family ATPase [Methylococcus sp.]